jgi:hypothetical protein
MAEITPVSKEAFAIMGACEETKKSFAITVDPKGRELKFVWAFKIDRAKAHKERFDAHHVNGTVTYDKNFPGCPHCHTHQFWLCQCGTMVCWHGQKRVTCPVCGYTGGLEMVSSVNLSGGGY